MRWAPLLVVAVLAACPGEPRTPTTPNITIENTQPDVKPTGPRGLEPPLPTLRLPKNFVATKNTIHLAIDPAGPGFSGTIQIAGTVSERSSTIWLHAQNLTITRAVAASGDPFDSRKARDVVLAAKQHGTDYLELHADHDAIEAGPATLTIEFTGTYDVLNTAGAFKQEIGKDAYIYTQLEAVYARRVFPCIDEPDSKVPWKLTLDVPQALVAVSNTPIVKDAPLGDDGKLRRVEFAETKPLPSYLVAFAVGPFAIVDGGATKRGTPVKIYALNQRGADAAWAAKSTARLLEIAEDWFGVPYPYEKLDFVTIPLTVGFSAMENAGMVTQTERQILLGPQASKDQQHVYAIVAAHEISHQWFGDLVTMKWWDDLWLNEGFATWAEWKITARFDPTWRDENNELDNHNAALAADALVSARKIRQPIETGDDIFTAFDGITYNKGAAILNMFEAYVGSDAMMKGVRSYLEKRAWGNATSNDLIAAIGEAAGKDLTAAFASVLDRPGAPELATTITCAKAAAPKVTIAQRRYLPPGAPATTDTAPFLVPVCLAFDQGGGKRGETCTLLEQPTTTVQLPTKACPRWVMPNVDARGYFRVGYTTAQLAALRDEAWPVLSQTERRGIVFDVATGAGTGRTPIALALSFVPKLLASADRFTVPEAIGIPTQFEHYVTDELRPKYDQWLRATFGPGAARVGFLPKATDTVEEEVTRTSLISTVGWTARDPELVAEAVRLSDKWAELPEAIRGLVLAIAVDAKPELSDKIRRDLQTETDRGRRGEMISALAGVRDPKRQRAALDMLLDPKLDIRETSWILHEPSTEATRKVAREYFKANAAAIMKRLPADGTADPAAEFASVFTRTCDPAQRDAVVAYITQTFGKLPGGERSVKQAIEGMDQCIAMRRLVEPEVRGWLAGVKIPKPKK